jgi:hypothetical protein
MPNLGLGLELDHLGSGPQYVTNGTFDADRAWSKSDPVSNTIFGGLARFTAETGVRRLYQASRGTYEFGKFYRVRGVMSGYSAGGLVCSLASDNLGLLGSSVTPGVNANGPFTFTVEITSLIGQFHMFGATTNGAFNLDNLSITPV